jgi:hypothetical protein
MDPLAAFLVELLIFIIVRTFRIAALCLCSLLIIRFARYIFIPYLSKGILWVYVEVFHFDVLDNLTELIPDDTPIPDNVKLVIQYGGEERRF